MKVLMINSVSGIRSTGRICTDLADALMEKGHECKIAYGREAAPEKYKDISYRIGSDADVKLHALKARIFDSAGFGSKKATERLIEKIKEYDPDIIHLHNIHGYYLNIEILFNYLSTADKPVVWTLHDCWAFTGHCSYYDYSKCDKWRDGCKKCPQKRSYPSSLFLDRSEFNWIKKKVLFTNVKNMMLVTPSEWLAALAEKSFLGKFPVRVINNGIDTEVFKPTHGNFRTAYRLENKKIILGVASIWDKRKGLDDFIKLADLIDDNYEIVLVGVNEKQKKILPSNIIGISRTNNITELAEIYTAAEVFVNTTYEDNYPTVNLEAQACGTPVVTYNTGGSVESVPKSNIVPQGDIGSLAEIIKLKKYTYESNSIFDFSKTIFVKKYIDIYNRMITRGAVDYDNSKY